MKRTVPESHHDDDLFSDLREMVRAPSAHVANTVPRRKAAELAMSAAAKNTTWAWVIAVPMR